MRIFSFFGVVLLLFIVNGCKPGNRKALTGKWRHEIPELTKQIIAKKRHDATGEWYALEKYEIFTFSEKGRFGNERIYQDHSEMYTGKFKVAGNEVFLCFDAIGCTRDVDYYRLFIIDEISKGKAKVRRLYPVRTMDMRHAREEDYYSATLTRME